MLGKAMGRLFEDMKKEGFAQYRLLAAVALVAITPVPAVAQGVAVASQDQVTRIDRRVGVLEKQVRAVQRKVFPGDQKYFEAEIAPPAAADPATTAGGTSPIVDLTQRVSVLEAQQRELTGRIEQLQHQMRQLQTAQEKFRGDAEFRLNALEGNPQPGAAGTETPGPAIAGLAAPGAAAPEPKTETPPPPKEGGEATAVSAKPAAEKPAPEKPAGDPIEAAYLAGYEKYTAKDYSGAVKDLTAFVEANPKHARASNAQFWAGRAMMAQGQNAQAAKAFLAGYQNYPRGQRAHNSLLWLGRSLLAMDQEKAACQALDQLRTAYPDRLTGQFATDVASTRKQAKCAG